MNEAPKRRALFPVNQNPPAPPPEAIIAVAERNGFPDAVERSVSTPAAFSAVQGRARRERRPKGREHQFNVRLRRDTLDFIYSQANDRNIPVAQVVEEMADALKNQQGGK